VIRAVVLDVGETLVDETETWGDWADWLGVPRLTFFSVLGAVIARGGAYQHVFELVRPGIDIAAERHARAAAGRRSGLIEADLYPDAVASLRALQETGRLVGIAANQPTTTETMLHALGVPLALVATSDGWGIAKPDPAFFQRICDELGLPAEEIAYVGDRLDNDIAPAAAAGMLAIFIRRGPWGYIQASQTDPHAVGAAATIGTLAELPELIERLASG
jgi:FMN phosphatase YigB (HAD superfamily)